MKQTMDNVGAGRWEAHVLSLVAGGLFVLSALVLTVPWGRRDRGRFSPVEVGYAARGPRGALLAAVRLLKRDGLVEVRPRLDMIERKATRVPKGTDPLARAVFEALRHHDHDMARLLEHADVAEELHVIGDRVQQAGLRVGPARRIGGVALGLAAPGVALIGVAHGVDPVAGISVAVGSVVGSVVTFRLNGTTFAGRRTFEAARLRSATSVMPPVRSAGFAGGGAPLFPGASAETPGGYGRFDGGGDSGGDSGGGGGSGGGD